MRRLKITILIFSGLAIIAAGVYYGLRIIKPKGAGLYIETNPNAVVFINSERVGTTPYDTVRDPGEVVIKLIPESTNTPLAPYEANINLVSGIKTTMRWDFGETNAKSTGDIVSFEKEAKGVTSIALISTPDSAQVIIDGSIKGFSPIKTTSVTPGDHKILVSATGFAEREIPVVAIQNHKLTAIVKLAEKETPTPSPSPKPKPKKVKILNTGTGFLRVRNKPSTAGEEIAQVKPGKEYEFLEIDKDTGWYKIVYSQSQPSSKKEEGWVSGEYVEELNSDPDNTDASIENPDNQGSPKAN